MKKVTLARDFCRTLIAYIKVDGHSTDMWTFAVVSGYSMSDGKAQLHARYAKRSCKIVLQHASNVIKVD
ncbi:hypothetical protein PC128_g18307 [Phytophthora cactorum]|nr:hypothetical protein PC120_g16018 [Phytophthora cactorum]KAG3074044.1 hypothetical protein PC121_g8463 [Phytophthora cactorum]KAG3173338.1 hypothetical protein PC128_g18307 [Phytophthora cactorum]KAG4050120.1 hypothetical protein PC123_g14631 [Phytophthora cactorum]